MRCTAQDFFHSKGIPGLLRRNLQDLSKGDEFLPEH